MTREPDHLPRTRTRKPVEKPSAERLRNIGGSLLPSAGHSTYQRKEGAYGFLEVRVMQSDLDTHGLFFARKPEVKGDPMHWTLLAMHPNGHSCERLAFDLIHAWITGDTVHVVNQIDYILRCGGMALDRESVARLARKEWG